MAKKTDAKGQDKRAGGGRKLLAHAREHQDALMAQGLSTTVLDRYDTALKGLESGGAVNVAAQTLIRDLQGVIGDVQGAIRKEFPGNTSFQSVFKAEKPMPTEAREVLALGRLVAKEAPDYSQNLIKHAVNAASVKHLTSLCDQLERELGGNDPSRDAKELEQQIRDAGRRAFEGKPELAGFDAR